MAIEVKVLRRGFWTRKPDLVRWRLFLGSLLFPLIAYMVSLLIWAAITKGMGEIPRLLTDNNAMALLLYVFLPIHVLAFALTFLPIFFILKKFLTFNTILFCSFLSIWTTIEYLTWWGFDFSKIAIGLLLIRFSSYFLLGALFWNWINQGRDTVNAH